jgi:uncharacterized protein
MYFGRCSDNAGMQGPDAAERPALNALTEQQEKSLRKALTTQRNKVFAVHAIQRVHERVDELAAQARARTSFDCRSGCQHCCHLRVEAMAPEVFLLARRVARMDDAARAALVGRLRSHAEHARGLTMEQHRLPCALLDEAGRCSAYEARPFMCRKLMSKDVKRCAPPAFDPQEDRELFLKAAAVTYGAHLGYGRTKLPNDVHELGQALLLALTDPQAEDRWFKGRQVFEPLPEASRP